jgi:hypothetical protein
MPPSEPYGSSLALLVWLMTLRRRICALRKTNKLISGRASRLGQDSVRASHERDPQHGACELQAYFSRAKSRYNCHRWVHRKREGAIVQWPRASATAKF